MVALTEFLQPVILGISLAAPLGPVTILILDKVLKKDLPSAYAISSAAIFGDFSWMLLSYFGISFLLRNVLLSSALKWLGVLILFFLGGYNLYEYFSEKVYKPQRKSSFFLIWFLTVSNPFTILLWTGIFSVNPHFVYGLSILLGVALWFLSLPLILNVLPKTTQTKTQRIISLISGLVIIGFGVYFLMRN